MITYFKDKNNKLKKKNIKYKTITTILKSFDTFVIIATTSSSVTLSLTGARLLAIPISTATACGLSIGNKVKYDIVIKNTINTKNKTKKTNKQLNLSISYTENLYKIIYSIKLTLKFHVIIPLIMLMKRKMNILSKYEYRFENKHF